MALELPAGVNKRYATLAAITISIFWLWIVFDRPYELPDNISWNIYSGATKPTATTSTHAIDSTVDLFDVPVLESEALKEVCYETHWNKSLVFTCDESAGGIGSIRSSVLHCIRYAVAAGASLVLPSIVLRNASDISHISTGLKTDLEYMFDVPYFMHSVRLSCPGLNILESKAKIKDLNTEYDAISLLPDSVVNFTNPIHGQPKLEKVIGTSFHDPITWRAEFYGWLRQFYIKDRKGPVVVDLEISHLQYPVASDGEGFALDFGSLLRFRADVRGLATQVIQGLAEQYTPNINLTADYYPNAFFGVHLRTEKDAAELRLAQDSTFSSFETQSRLYLDQTPQSQPSVIYVSSGDLDEVAKFTLEATKNNNTVNIPVVTKFDLLKGVALAELNALTWDQQAMVDFLVMLKASDFAGVGHSGFAWNIALKRHTLAQQKKYLDGPQMLSDDLSQIYGNVRGYPEFAACIWP
ncbi:hypothetical protein GLAREA_00769 [Glarea lozoyensis ATCC 20868]|uniref:Alternative oxidase n=1 Tax=Glarea lozoyensis (strain ATCC 20868 / MF5171) TaxID=1116229 RepID=S3CXE8_GLAL2|nr:uncharacterized protein GLAREA_00769 [Glarea lozoyensis ATCC 20868]EPE29609.1 hypothetical protein GLAREA_00769 [Glarea lozoyensis ATCC 20868]